MGGFLPVFLSSSFIKAMWPLAVIFNLPLHAGSSSFQSAALEKQEAHISKSEGSLSFSLTGRADFKTVLTQGHVALHGDREEVKGQGFWRL